MASKSRLNFAKVLNGRDPSRPIAGLTRFFKYLGGLGGRFTLGAGLAESLQSINPQISRQWRVKIGRVSLCRVSPQYWQW